MIYRGDTIDDLYQEVPFTVRIYLPEAIQKYVIEANKPPVLLNEPSWGQLYRGFRAGEKGLINFGGVYDYEGAEVRIELTS